MPAISIKRRHKLDHKKAKAAAEKIARDLNKRFDLAYKWEGDHSAVSRVSTVARNSSAPAMCRNAAKPRSRKPCNALKPAARAGCRIAASAERVSVLPT